MIIRTACPSTHPLSYGDTTPNIGLCYAECVMANNAKEMSGRNYYDQTNGVCSIVLCQPGYYLNGGACKTCPAGYYCDGTLGGIGDGSTACSTLGAGDTFTEWLYSAAGSDAKEDCYSTCSDREVTYGHAYPVHETENWPALCTFTGTSTTGNPCKEEQLAAGQCVESGCNSNFEMKNGKCQLCNRENATTYEPTGNCIIAQCTSGYHPNGDACASNVTDCTVSIPNATVANSTWNTTTKSFDMCKVESCEDGSHVASNSGVLDDQTCIVPHGVGTQAWNPTTKTWNTCVATSCDAGYTNDSSEKNNQNEQCSECRNKYAENGDQAVSSYVRGCEIASCMYQGEKYALENGECVPICLPTSDETGSRHWDSTTKRCVQTCEPGYVSW